MNILYICKATDQKVHRRSALSLWCISTAATVVLWCVECRLCRLNARERTSSRSQRTSHSICDVLCVCNVKVTNAMQFAFIKLILVYFRLFFSCMSGNLAIEWDTAIGSLINCIQMMEIILYTHIYDAFGKYKLQNANANRWEYSFCFVWFGLHLLGILFANLFFFFFWRIWRKQQSPERQFDLDEYALASVLLFACTIFIIYNEFVCTWAEWRKTGLPIYLKNDEHRTFRGTFSLSVCVSSISSNIFMRIFFSSVQQSFFFDSFFFLVFFFVFSFV